MTVQSRPAAAGFHSGELAVQRQAGVEAQAARLAPMVARDRTGRLWASLLLGPPGLR